MNYLKEIVGFERLAELKSLGAPERVVWYALMSIANTLGWPATFNVPNVTLQSKTGLSRNDVYIARNKLSQKGFIEYKASTGNKAPNYSLISTINTQTDTQTQHKSIHKPVPYSKLNETKQNQGSDGRARPGLDEVKAYCAERGNKVDPVRWHDYYAANGWRVGKNPMKDWRAAVRTWERNGYDAAPAIREGSYD